MIVTVLDQSQVSVVRRTAMVLAQTAGLDEQRSSRLGLVATEMATNLLKHASGGEIIVDRFADSSGVGVELLALDKGAGITDIGRALEDGFSTAGSPGTGLGAIRRQSDQFGVFSRPGGGTAVLARIDAAAQTVSRSARSHQVQLSAVLAPYPGETECGDSWAFSAAERGPTLLSVDGSGHGPHAANAGKMAVSAFEEYGKGDLIRLMEAAHRMLAPTRGAAAAVARVDTAERVVRFVGVGNISGSVLSAGSVKKMVSHNGTVGHLAPRIREFTYPYQGRVTVILHSDGISTKWDLDAYPGLGESHPSLIAGILFRDHRRKNDDASIVVMRVEP